MTIDTLTPAEAAFFDSRGETALPVETPAVVETPSSTPDTTVTPDVSATPDTIPGADGQARDEKGKFVPHGAFHEERSKRQALERDLSDMRSKQAVLEDRWNTLLSLQKTQEAAPTAPPSPEEDLFANLKWQADQVKALQTQIADRDKTERETREAAEQETAVWSHWQRSADEYGATNKDFTQARDWMANYRMKQLEALAIIDPRMATPEARNQQINAELKSIIVAAHQQSRNPAELVHQLAVGYGFSPAAATTTTPAAAAADPNASLVAKIAELDKAMTASKTLTASNGKNAADPMSAEAILQMSDNEFSVWMRNPENAKTFDRILKQ